MKEVSMTHVRPQPTRLRILRERYGLSQEKLARAADLTVNTYRSAEYGNNVSYSTAKAILDALNGVKQERRDDLVLLELDDLGLSIV
jgi:transcriptional regulator with XRE-family HTH domain